MQGNPNGNNGNARRNSIKSTHAPVALNCLVVEHNHRQGNILRDYIVKTPGLHFSAYVDASTEVYQLAIQHKADIIFWDIRLIDASLMHRFKESGNHPIIICISTKAEEERKETDMDVFSYLSKPLSFERFLNIVNRIRDYLSAPSHAQVRSSRFLFVKSEYRIIKVAFEDILFCEGMKDYTQVYVKGKAEPLLTLNNLKLFYSKLPTEEFIRVHRSYIVSISQIDSIARNEIYVGKKIIPIGDSYKDDFYQMIDANS